MLCQSRPLLNLIRDHFVVHESKRPHAKTVRPAVMSGCSVRKSKPHLPEGLAVDAFTRLPVEALQDDLKAIACGRPCAAGPSLLHSTERQLSPGAMTRTSG